VGSGEQAADRENCRWPDLRRWASDRGLWFVRVLTDYVGLISGTALYDESGQLVQEVSHIRLLGESLYYNSTDPTKSVVGGPAESENDRIDWASASTTALAELQGESPRPRSHLHGDGHWVANMNTGEYVFNSGQNQFVDGDVAALCDYLK